jgi:hypothetical protein
LINASSGVSWVQPSRTFREDTQQVRTGNQPSAYAAIRNLVTAPSAAPDSPASPTPAAITA